MTWSQSCVRYREDVQKVWTWLRIRDLFPLASCPDQIILRIFAIIILHIFLRSQIAENIEGFKKRLEALRGVKNMILGHQRRVGPVFAHGGNGF